MRIKNMLLIILITLVVTAIASQFTGATVMAAVAVNPIATTGVAIGSTFRINVTIDDVTNLWGYQFMLEYNTTVLTATAFKNLANITYSLFNEQEPSIINDTAGYVVAAYHAPMGNSVGITTADPLPLTQITFRVDANGTSTLNIVDTGTHGIDFADVYGNSIKPPFNMVISDGFFSNVGGIELHDVAVTSITTNTTSAKPGDVIGIEVTVKNNGNFNETFTVKAQFNTSLTSFKEPPIGTKSITNLAEGASTTLTYTWNTAGLAEGKYVVRATATLTGENRPTDNVRDSALITLSKGGTGDQMNLIYIGGAVAVIVIVVVAVYVLRRRK